MTTPVRIQQSIRQLETKGLTHTQIARELGVSRTTVVKYATRDYSPVPPTGGTASRSLVAGEYARKADEWLEADRRMPRKQRHTARRVHERLVEECGFEGSYSSVQRWVKRWRQRHRGEAEGFSELEWAPGSAQVDFGQALAVVAGVERTVHFLVVSFPYSNMRYVAALPGETAECVCHGLNKVFSHAGMVPRVLVFDNATGVGQRKQRHTARRVHERLVEECGFEGSYSSVQRWVKRWRQRHRGEAEGFSELEWAPGSAQVDFGQALAVVAGVERTVHFLVVSFPYSNMRYVAALPGETAECVCHGLNKVFSHAGMVPRVLVFDNATGVGHRRADGTVTQTRLFSLFCAHYGFETRFCNPYSGWEKGSTENAVGFLRRNLMVPTPSAEGWDRLTDAWLERCDEIARGVHYREDVPIRDLFETDLDHMLPLPPSMFDACDWRGVKADRTGTVTIDSNRYLAGPKWHSMRLMAGVRALRVELRSMDGEPIVTLERRWGRSPDTAMDPLSLLAIIARKPRSWGESPIRSDFPEETRVLLDRMEPRERGLLVDDIRHAAVVSGFRAAVMAVVEIVAAGRRPDRAAIDQTARRIAQGDGPESRARLDTYSRFMREDGDE